MKPMKELTKGELKKLFGHFAGREVSVILDRAYNAVADNDPTIAEMSKVAQDNGIRFRTEVEGGPISHGGPTANRVTAVVTKAADGKWRISDIIP